MPLIALLAGVALGADHGTLGVQVGVVAPAGSAAPTVDGLLGVWVSYAPRPWGVALDFGTWHHVDGAKPFGASSLYQISRVQLHASALLELALGTHATTFHAGLGPALGWTGVRVRYGRHDVRDGILQPGIAGRIALDGPISGALGWQWRFGVTSRGYQVDYDTALGLGVSW